MAARSNAKKDSSELQASREAAGVVWELGAILPPEVVAKIYADTMRELGQAAGLIPKALKHNPPDSSSGPTTSLPDWGP